MATPLQAVIVEDRPADAELLVKELQRAGYALDWRRVDTLRDFQALLSPNLQIVLADYSLPGFTAIDTLAVLQKSGMDVPFLVVSGSIGDDRAVECLKSGATDYILKDRMARLGPAVQRALQDRQNRIEMRQAREALERSEAKMRGILSTVEDVVWSLSLADGRLIYVNPAVEKLTGRRVEEFLADPQKWLETIHPEDQAKMAKAQEEAVRWGRYESEYRMVRADGTVRSVVVRAWTAYGPDGKPLRLEGIFTDVTDRRAREQADIDLAASQRETDRLTQLNEFKSQFLNMVTHDLNNVLTPMRLNLRMVADEIAKAGAHVPHVDTLRSGVERLASFLADLLDASRLQSGKLVLNRAGFDLAASLRELVGDLAAQASANKLDLTLDAPASLPLHGDRHRLDQVATNLLSNAFKFTPEGGRVTVSLSQVGAEAHLVVRDTGRGIAKEDQAKLFQPFTRLGPVPQGKHTGTGLGLFLSRGLVEQHGGTIWCESAGPGKGSAFHVRLPVAQPG